MSDLDPAPLRRKLARHARQTEKNKTRLTRMIGEDPSTLNWELLNEHSVELQEVKAEYNRISSKINDVETNPTAIDQDMADADKWEDSLLAARTACKLLMSMKQVHSLTQGLQIAVTSLNDAFNSEPDKSHAETLTKVLTLSAKLEAELLASSLEENHRLRREATTILKESALVQSKPVKAIKTEEATSSSRVDPDNPYKLVNVPVPRFSGKMQDWVPFWSKFQQQVANRRGLDDQGKLAYLLQGMNDQELRTSIEKQAHKEGAYELIVAELHDRFDQPSEFA